MAGIVPTLLATAAPALQAFGFTYTGTDFVMSNSATTLAHVDPTSGVQSPYLTLSEIVGLDGLDYVPASDGSYRITVLANTVRDQVNFGNQRRTLTISVADPSITENGGSRLIASYISLRCYKLRQSSLLRCLVTRRVPGNSTSPCTRDTIQTTLRLNTVCCISMAQGEMKCAAPTLEKQDDSPGISVSPVR